ncbi:hypothetical protein [Acetobacter sp. P1H12_c]|uniref:hypothetical protein n=1 Tax=Acetobacter sp. P1H12_c TaxID=2762621 RepID=UPI001C04DDAD|nr:hypothetical protein [Acetobacter sp. P1H12_c]
MLIFRAVLDWLHPGNRVTLRFRVCPQIEHELYDLPPVDPHLDRWTADREALALIAQWAAQHRREGADHA